MGVRNARPPHVVIATRVFLPEAAAASFRLGELAATLRDAGAEVAVLTTSVAGKGGSTPEDVDVRRAPVHRDSEGYIRGYLCYASFDLPLAFRLLTARRPDIVVCEPPPTTGAVVRIVCALRRVPYVYYAADIWSDAAASTGAPRVVVRLLGAAERWATRAAVAVLSVSDGVSRRLSDWLPGERIVTVGNGIDLDLFSPAGPRGEIPGPYLIYAGTASEFQGASIFVDAFEDVLEEYPSARLVFLGQGSDFPRIREAADRLPAGRVLVEGRQSAEAAAALLRGASASVVSIRPGIGYDFALPTKMYASAACGTPVLYAGPGPSRELITDNDLGWATDYDASRVALAMRAALAAEPSPEHRNRLAAWAQENASLRAAAERSAEVVLNSIPNSR